LRTVGGPNGKTNGAARVPSHAGADPRDRFLAAQRLRPVPGEAEGHALHVAERAAIGQRQADRVGEAGVVAEPRVLVERQMIRGERHVVGEQRAQPARGGAGHRRQAAAPDQAVVHHDQIGAQLEPAIEQHLVGRHAADDGVDLGRALDLQPVGRVVAEAIDLERGVEVRDDLAEVGGHRSAGTIAAAVQRRRGKRPSMATVKKPSPPAPSEPKTLSGLPLQASYGPGDLAARGWTYEQALGDPGSFPFTRGPHATMYRGKPWTMRMFAGFGTPEDTNQRFKFLLASGQTGLSTAFDMPTLMGYDPEHPRSLGEVGREGVSVASLDDMTRLFGDIPLDQVSTSMTINAPAAVLLALYIASPRSRASAPRSCAARCRTTCSRSSSRRRSGSAPIRGHMRIIRDMLVWCTKHMPLWNTISISGYHIREAGATGGAGAGVHARRRHRLPAARQGRRHPVDEFAPRLSFFWDVHNDFFEEIAKFRAGRRMWAKIMRERFGAKNPRSWMLRTHAQTAGVSLMAQQPLNNVVRTTMQALAAVLGGTQSLHTNSYDETYALPTEAAASSRCAPSR
jgi:hypothetical protein